MPVRRNMSKITGLDVFQLEEPNFQSTIHFLVNRPGFNDGARLFGSNHEHRQS